jgi:hypothetical protein
MAFDPKKPINVGDYTRGPALKPADIAPATEVVVTVASVVDVERPGDNRGRSQLCLTLREFDGGNDDRRSLYLNGGDVAALAEKYGNVPSGWEGKRVPVVVTTVFNPTEGRDVEAMHVAPSSAWNDVLGRFDKAVKGKRARK